MTVNFSEMAVAALRSAVQAKMGLNKEAEEKYRKEGKLEAAAVCSGRYEAFYEVHALLSRGQE